MKNDHQYAREVAYQRRAAEAVELDRLCAAVERIGSVTATEVARDVMRVAGARGERKALSRLTRLVRDGRLQREKRLHPMTHQRTWFYFVAATDRRHEQQQQPQDLTPTEGTTAHG